jgi:molecular chaperone DnaK
VEKTIADNRQKIAVGDLSRIEALIASVRSISQGDDLAAIRKATEELQHASHAVAEQLYNSQGSQADQGSHGSHGAQGSQGGHGSNVKDAEVVDAEYAETK